MWASAYCPCLTSVSNFNKGAKEMTEPFMKMIIMVMIVFVIYKIISGIIKEMRQ